MKNGDIKNAYDDTMKNDDTVKSDTINIPTFY